MYGQFAWMAYSRWGRTKTLYRGTKISFVRQVNDLFMKYNIPLALLAAARTWAEGVNDAFTVMPRSLICSHFCSDLPAVSSDRAIRRSGVPPFDRWWLLLAFFSFLKTTTCFVAQKVQKKKLFFWKYHCFASRFLTVFHMGRQLSTLTNVTRRCWFAW